MLRELRARLARRDNAHEDHRRPERAANGRRRYEAEFTRIRKMRERSPAAAEREARQIAAEEGIDTPEAAAAEVAAARPARK